MTRVIINVCFGGFGLSDAAYERLIELGVPVQKYIEEERDPETGLYTHQSLNDGKVIFDRTLTPKGEDRMNDLWWEHPDNGLLGRFWESWLDDDRTNPLLIQVVEELGDKANGRCARLKIVEVPDDVKWEIDEYDGNETIEEEHRSWR